MLYYDTYILVEIKQENPKFIKFLDQDFIINDMTMAEFYIIIYKEKGQSEADYWHKRLASYCHPVSREILIKALKYRIDHKKEDLSIFDCVGYIYALENNLKFVTGDKEFKNKEGVLFIQK
mgnify:CR=1 FL=1